MASALLSPEIVDALASTLLKRMHAMQRSKLHLSKAVAAVPDAGPTVSPATPASGSTPESTNSDFLASLDSTLSRSSSSLSASSQETFGARRFTDSLPELFRSDDEDGDDAQNKEANFLTYDSITDKRGDRVKYDQGDKVMVNMPLMELLDAQFLAPLQSTLFSFQKKNDGRGAYKSYQSLQFFEFKMKIKPLIRSLCSRSDSLHTNLAARYFWCAYDLVRKRRANHIQSWRIYKCPKDLIYGGREEFIKKHGDPWANNPLFLVTRKKKRRRKRKLQYPLNQQPQRDESVVQPAALITQPVFSSTSETLPTVKPVLPEASGGGDGDPDPAQFRTTIKQPAALITHPVFSSASETLSTAKIVLPEANGGGGGDPDPAQFRADPFADDADVFRCVGCQNNFPKLDAFPRSHTEWATPTVDLRCRSCFDQYTKRDLLPQVNKEVAAEEERVKAKNRKRKLCRCGATTHSMVTSKLCPLNKRYNRDDAIKEAVRRRAVAGATQRAKRAKKADTKPPVVAADVPPPPAVTDTKPPSPPPQQFQVGANVYAKWSKGQWFLGQVTAYKNGKYDVYFLCGTEKNNMPPTSLRESDSRYPTRAEMIGKEFFFDGASDLPEGRWKVRQLRDNQFRCTRLTGTGANVENFDIGYVIKQYMQESDTRRESGWAPVLATRTRRGRKNK